MPSTRSRVSRSLKPHQLEALESLLAGRPALFMDAGTGKTRVVLAYLAETRAQRTIVVCPKSAVAVWAKELAEVGYKGPLLRSDRNTVNAFAEGVRHFEKGIVLVHYDVYWREPLRKRLRGWNARVLVFDEAHSIRNRKARKTKMAHLLADNVPVKLALTGTPSSEGPENLWSIYRAIDPSKLGRRWGDFERRYIVKGGYLNYETVGYRNLDEIKAVVDATSYQCAKEDVLELPGSDTIDVPVELTPKTRRVYDRMSRDAIVELEEGGHAVGRIVLTQLLRLHQITCGFVTAADGTVHDLGTEKAEAARDIVESAVYEGRRVVIFTRFARDVEKLEKVLAPWRVARFTGTESAKAREANIQRLNTGDVDVLITQIKAGSMSVDMTGASVAIFYSVEYSLSDYQQAHERVSRWGQTRNVTYYHLVAENSIDDAIYGALRRKARISELVTAVRYSLTS